MRSHEGTLESSVLFYEGQEGGVPWVDRVLYPETESKSVMKFEWDKLWNPVRRKYNVMRMILRGRKSATIVKRTYFMSRY